MASPWSLLAALALPILPAPRESFTDDQRSHWAYQPIVRPEVPEVQNREWPRTPIDRFLLAGMEAVEFEPAPEADKAALLRRVTWDLTGLPPTPEALEAFLRDDQPGAYERVVDRLLASPQYGERWAQHWLDLAHYADSNGFELDAERPDAWRYRDWVIQSLNADMPYDEFVTLQLAGDEARPGDPKALIATGFGRCGPREVVSGNIDPEVKRQSELTEVAGTVGSVFLGLTMGCARCHDHKFDAIPTTDYYRLQAVFSGAQFEDVPIADEAERKAYEKAKADVAAEVKPFREQMAKIEAPYRKKLREEKEAMLTAEEKALLAVPEKERTPEQKKRIAGINNTALRITWEEVAEAVAHNPADHRERERLKREIHEVEVTLPRPPAQAMALREPKPQAATARVLRRGEVKNKGPLVEPGPPGIVLASMPADSFRIERPSRESTTTGRRLAFARWLTSPENPLTARVIVNRLWQQHFGRGLVSTSSDWGVQGEEPAQPELLDWMASELVAGGWKLKAMHRLMVTSSAYRQSSQLSIHPKQVSEDPQNEMVSRMPRRRLDAESLRDALLGVTGELNPRMGGPGVLVPIEREIEDLIFTEAEVVDIWPVDADPAEHARRSIYLFRKRNVRYAMFDAFDAPDTQNACPQRNNSIHALQALTTLNSAFSLDRAKALAERLGREAPGGVRGRVELAYRLVLCRPPSADDLARAEAFLASQAEFLAEQREAGAQVLAAPESDAAWDAPAEAAAWVDFCLALMNTNEFVYLP